ncbi:MAG: TetR/AcrR family transcriptional regulator [Okeania sp. SIO2C9]|uniref:TetR/AcrR family transcriptional regulator n=1 Tax=Okeania sp. SIO2C9 TaxID=2607791 RepID=UPI0013BFD831|nr:TetR/AcrR family transcriptional regulator [Okeania sp. SIO2C9]NEQ73043.1 TetR/AcrR family transcriptional regulator [Okeania sp. SIO2C9]
MSKNSTIDTKEQILNAAEKLFASLGFAGTSLRAIIREADVNLAAVHYHFGSKEELFIAVIRRVAQPIVEEQMRQLAILEDSEELPSVAEIVAAVITPPLQMTQDNSEECLIHAKFMGRCRTEPYPIQRLAEAEFSRTHQRFLDIMQKVLPNQSPMELEWKLDLVIAMLIRVLNQIEPLEPLSEKSSSEDIEDLVERLVTFITFGISA